MKQGIAIWRSTSLGLLFTAALLGGCGGSSSSKATDTEVSGIAAKGIVLGARVQAFNAADELVAETSTSPTDGSYSLDVTSFSGPLTLVLSNPVTPPLAEVVCDTALCGVYASGVNAGQDIVFGDHYPLNFELRAAINVAKKATLVSAAITPLTTLVADFAATSDTLSQASIEAANNAVRAALLLDADPGTITPVDLTAAASASEQALEFALLNAAFAEVSAAAGLDLLMTDLAAEFQADALSRQFIEDLKDAIANAADATEANNASLGAAVQQAATVLEQRLAALLADCSADACQVPEAVPVKLQANLDRAKALVQAVRTVTIDAANLVAGDQDSNPDNVLNRIGDASALMNQDAFQATMAAAYVAEMLAVQLQLVLIEGLPLETDIQQAAGTLFDTSYSYRDQCPSSWAWLGYASAQECLDDQDLGRSQFVAYFKSGDIERNGRLWSVSDAVISGEGVGATDATVSMQFNVPEDIAGLAKNEFISVNNVSSAYGTAKIEVETLRIDTALSAAITTFEGLDPNTLTPQAISIELKGFKVSMQDDPRYIQADMKLSAVRSAKLASLNTQSETLFLLPKQASLTGKLFDQVSGEDQGLDLSLVLTFVNAESFGFVDEGFERSDLATYSYATNTLTITIGTSVYTLSRHATWPDYLTVTCAGAGCASASRDAWIGDVYYRLPAYGDEADLGGSCDQYGCHIPWNESLDLRVALRSENLWHLDFIKVEKEEGVFQLGTDQYRRGLGISNQASAGKAMMTLRRPNIDINKDGRFIKALVAASVTGKLSPNLPAMKATLNANRSAYRTAAADLTLQWDDSLVRIDVNQSNVDLDAGILESFSISDGQGTKMQVVNLTELPHGGNGDIGDISKDGTRYGTLRRENGVILVHWIDNRIETLF